MKNPEQLLNQYLAEARVISLSTIHENGRPQGRPVNFVTNAERNFYWASLPTTQHSRNIHRNAFVAGVILVKEEMPTIGIYVEGTAEQAEPSPDNLPIVEQYAKRFMSGKPEWISDFTAGLKEHQLYKLTPSSIILADEEHFPDDPQQKLI